MGTSGAYGGSPGWNHTRKDTESWLIGKVDEGEPNPDQCNANQSDQQSAIEPTADQSIAQLNPYLIALFGRIASHLSRELMGSGAREPGTNGAGRTLGNVSGRRRAATSGGVAVAGVYGLRNRSARATNDVGLDLDDLENLSSFEKARRIVDVATMRSGLIEDAELREVNANFVSWEIEQALPPTPEQLVRQWVTECVFRVWLTEAGEILRNGLRDGISTHGLEREARATLEAAVSRIDIPLGGIRATHFESAIRNLLGMLGRIYAAPR